MSEAAFHDLPARKGRSRGNRLVGERLQCSGSRWVRGRLGAIDARRGGPGAKLRRRAATAGNLRPGVAFSCAQDAIGGFQSGVMNRISTERSADQLHKDFGIFLEGGFLVAVGSLLLLAAAIVGTLLYVSS